ncbi:MAG: methionine--tRNA ligase [Opitutae bacterium]|nr:methionine--tRNA ligase [Opitutae bacterium]|tara:strand:- start:2552 stop:4078 length:1527 start_codon:yes stop_codon:yes gene_type:complete
MKKAFYLTTAIDYANGSPHLGHAYEKILADVIARCKRLTNNKTYFLTGLDEHGQKVQQAAEKEGISPQQRCDGIALEFQNLLTQLNISNNDYIRTTQQRHKSVVSKLLQDLFDRGEIYKAEYKGFYSTRAEQFLQEKDKIDGEWPKIYGEVTEISESNYFFRLGKYQDWLIEHLNKNDDFIIPHFRKNQVLEFLKEPLNDLCISRPKNRLSWGIPLPFDENFVTYVWFDALVNYVSACGYGEEKFDEYWPADLHIIGKDILAPPHAVYWPIMLHASNLKLPKQILAHGWWMTSGEKMSKSSGDTVNPLDLIKKRGVDPFRYFVMREMTVGQDADFSVERFESRYKTDLGNDLGNLVSRLFHMIEVYEGGVVPEVELNEEFEQNIRSNFEKTKSEVLKCFDLFQFNQGLNQIFVFIRSINKYADERTPWKLAKSDDPKDRLLLKTCLGVMCESLRLAIQMLAPILPEVHSRVNQLMGLPPCESWETDLCWDFRLAGQKLEKKIILFPRD